MNQHTEHDDNIKQTVALCNKLAQSRRATAVQVTLFMVAVVGYCGVLSSQV